MATRVFNPYPALRHEERLKVATLLQMFQCTDVRTIRDALEESGGDFHRAMDMLLSLVCISQQVEPMDYGLTTKSVKPFDWDLELRPKAQAGAAPRRKSLDWIEGPSTFPELPWELFVEIVSFLPKRDLCNLRLLNTAWRDLVDSDQIWKDKLMHSYGLRDIDSAVHPSWKHRFMDADRLRFCADKKSRWIELLSDGRTAKDHCKLDEKFRWVTVLTDNIFSAGQHYIEILVDTCCDNSKNTIKIGFGCADRVSAYTYNCPFGYSHGSYTAEDRNSWVYLADGRIMARNQCTSIAGNCWSKNDRIGLLMDFFAQTVSFYWNSRLQGRPLPLHGCVNLHVAVSLIGGNQVSLTNSSINSILK